MTRFVKLFITRKMGVKLEVTIYTIFVLVLVKMQELNEIAE